MLSGLVVLLALTAPAAVFKCEADAKVSYASVPCAQASQLPEVPSGPVVPFDPRIKARSEHLTRERLAREGREQNAFNKAQRAAAGQQRQCLRARLRQRWLADDLARSSGAAHERLLRRLQRQGVLTAMACQG